MEKTEARHLVLVELLVQSKSFGREGHAQSSCSNRPRTPLHTNDRGAAVSSLPLLRKEETTMMSSLIAPGSKLALSSFAGSRIRLRGENGPPSRQLLQLSTASPTKKPSPSATSSSSAAVKPAAANFRCFSSAYSSSTPALTATRRRVDAPISDVRRGDTRLAAVAGGDAAAAAGAPKPTFDKAQGGYTKAFLLVRLTVFLR